MALTKDNTYTNGDSRLFYLSDDVDNSSIGQLCWSLIFQLQEDECFSLKDLAVNGKDVKKTMMLKEGKDVGYWLNEILKRVIDGELNNNRDDLIYWMTGITDGWIKY